MIGAGCLVSWWIVALAMVGGIVVVLVAVVAAIGLVDTVFTQRKNGGNGP